MMVKISFPSHVLLVCCAAHAKSSAVAH